MLRLPTASRSRYIRPRIPVSWSAPGHSTTPTWNGLLCRCVSIMSAASSSTSEPTGSWSRVTAGQDQYDVFTKPIQKSPQDDRGYMLIKLANGLQAILVHDAKADKAAASLDVAVGHLYDPVSFHLSVHTIVLPRQVSLAHTRAQMSGRSDCKLNRMTCPVWPISASICCSWSVPPFLSAVCQLYCSTLITGYGTIPEGERVFRGGFVLDCVI